VRSDTTYYCQFYSEACCTIDVAQKPSCTELGGEICADDGEECQGSYIPGSLEGACCSDFCVETTEDDCTQDSDCFSGEICSLGECVASGGNGNGEDGSNNKWVWIIVLVILIGLVALGIIYRNKLRIWFLKRKGKIRTERFTPRGGPGEMPRGRLAPRRMPSFGRRMGRGPPARPVRRAPPSTQKSAKDKEREETMKKLREMSK